MKKFLSIAIVNIILVVAVIIIMDGIYAVFSNIYGIKNSGLEDCQKEIKMKRIFKFNKFGLHHFGKEFDKALESDNRFFVDDNIKNKKGSVVVLGCSFGYGAFLNRDDSFSGVLHKLTGRNVYNMAFQAYGLAQALYTVSNEKFYQKIKDVPEYAIYIIMNDHLTRSLGYSNGFLMYPNENSYNSFLSYKLDKNGNLREKNDYFLLFLGRFTLFSRLYKKYIAPITIFGDDDKNFDFVKAHFVEMKKNLQKYNPNIKFIILKYPYDFYKDMDYSPNKQNIYYDYEVANKRMYGSERWKELEKDFTVIELDEDFIGFDVNDKKYQLPDGHPNKLAWKTIVPKVIKKLNL